MTCNGIARVELSISASMGLRFTEPRTSLERCPVGPRITPRKVHSGSVRILIGSPRGAVSAYNYLSAGVLLSGATILFGASWDYEVKIGGKVTFQWDKWHLREDKSS